MQSTRSPFDLNQADSYARWRDAKLAGMPSKLDDLIVEVRDPRQLTDAEAEAISKRCRRANMAIYVGRTGDDPDKEIPRQLGLRFGLKTLDHNPGADEDAITSLSIQPDAFHRGFIPYTDRPIAWHTDGYYNGPERQIHGMILHCVHPAAEGGENALLDPEWLYLQLREQDPAHIEALQHPQAMSIPPNVVDGEEVRPRATGPVFSTDAEGHLHMRYTDRKRSIDWREDAATSEAVAALRALLADERAPVFQAKLESGWGLVCNNVLHTRTQFSDAGQPRLMYRARYYERMRES